MTNDIKNDENFKCDSDELFTIIRIPWNKTADEEWSGFKNQMAGRDRGRIIQLMTNVNSWKIAAAAVLVISLSIGLFINNYTVEVKSLAATDKSVELPD